MNPHNVCAVKNGRRHGRGGSEFGFDGGFSGQKMFARRPHHDRQIENGELVQAPQDLRILLLALAEPEARVDHDPFALQALPHRAVHGRVELHRQIGHRIFERRQLGPRLRRAAHVVQDQPGVGLNDRARELRVRRQAGRIVDDIGAQLQRLGRHARLIGIHRKRNRQPSLQTLQNRNQPPQFLGFGYPHRAGAHRFGSDVDDVGALFLQLHGAREGAVGIAVFSAVRERIGRDVENSHQQRAFAQLQGLVSEFPFVMLTGHGDNSSVACIGEARAFFRSACAKMEVHGRNN